MNNIESNVSILALIPSFLSISYSFIENYKHKPVIHLKKNNSIHNKPTLTQNKIYAVFINNWIRYIQGRNKKFFGKHFFH